MTETTDYKNAPADIKATAYQIASTYDFDRAVLSGAICAAILAEREAQRERDAKIADFGVKWSPPVANQKIIDESCSRIAAAIRNP